MTPPRRQIPLPSCARRAPALGCLLAALVALPGACKKEAECNAGTLFLDLTLPQAGVHTLGITVSAAAGGKVLRSASADVAAGKTRWTVELGFGAAGYPQGQAVDVSVLGLDGETIVASGRTTSTLDGACRRLAVTLVAAAGDGGGGSRDGGASDGPAGVSPGSDAAAVIPPGSDGPLSPDGPVDAPEPEAGSRDAYPIDASCTGVCKPGETAPCGRCGTKVCKIDCTWEACTAEGACQAAETRMCGNCGTEKCAGNCQWSGTCETQGVCKATTVEACGNCGTRTCGATCTWGACAGEGTCTTGQTRTCGKCGTERCGGGTGCGWSGVCETQGDCSAGETRPCGNCGIERCGGNCRWSGTCESEGVCRPTTTGACGNCGTRTCTSSCTWGACGSQGACSPGSTQGCGRCNLGSHTCTAACAWPTTCDNNTGCTAGGAPEACGTCGLRSCNTMTCVLACREPSSCCNTPVSDGWMTLGNSSTPWASIFGDPTVSGGQLVLSFDDVVRRQNLAGGMQLSFAATFDNGDMALEMDFGVRGSRTSPAIRRTGMSLVLGGLTYGVGNAFGSFGSWNGITRPLAPVTVTIYVRATAREVAARAQIGSEVFRSGFVSVPGYDAILDLVGGNSNGANGSSLRVGTVTGCAGLTDDAVMGLYLK